MIFTLARSAYTPHRYRLTLDTPVLVHCTCMQVPVCSRHRLQDRAQRLAGMWDTLVMGSIFSGQPMLTCRWQEQSVSIFAFETKKDNTLLLCSVAINLSEGTCLEDE